MSRRVLAQTCRLLAGTSLSLPLLRSGLARSEPHRVVLYYHRVYRDDTQPVYQLGIHRDRFRRQLRDLQRIYRFVPLMELLEAGHAAGNGERRAALTFDDGYRDNLEEAVPVLDELGIPATVFLVTGLIGTDRRPWYDEMKVVVERAPQPELPLPREIGGGVFWLGPGPHRREALLGLLDRLKAIPDSARRSAVEALRGRVEEDAWRRDTRDRLLSWEDVRLMESRGICFGSHTVSHPLLSRIDDPEVLRAELRESWKALETRLRSPLRVLAYPGGDWSPVVRDAVREAGYIWALANRPGVLDAATDPFSVPRRGVGPLSSDFLGRHSAAVLRAEVAGVTDRARRRASAPARGNQVAGVSAAFDKKADDYIRRRAADPAFAGEQQRILEFLPSSPGRALEVGCGSGVTSTRLAAGGWKVVATDISLEMLKRTRLTAAAGGVVLTGLVRCDAQCLPFRGDRADLLVCHGVFEYLPDLPRALREVRRILIPGGVAVVTVPNQLSPAGRVASLLGLGVRLVRLLQGRRVARVRGRHRLPWRMDALARDAGLTRRGGVLQTFGLLPASLCPRSLLAFGNRTMERLPRWPLLRWWGFQYIARYERPANDGAPARGVVSGR